MLRVLSIEEEDFFFENDVEEEDGDTKTIRVDDHILTKFSI